MENTSPAPVSAPASNANHPKFVKWAVVLGIVVVLNLFFTVARTIILPAPDYATFCPQSQSVNPNDAATCDKQGGVWTDTSMGAVPTDSKVTAPKAEPLGYCDMYAKCQAPYNAAQTHYQLYGFIFMVVLGVLSIIIGLLPVGASIVSAGLSYGGVVALIIGAMGYWNEAGDWLKLGITFIALVALLYIGWKRFKD